MTQNLLFITRLVWFFFMIFGLMVALPLVVWDVTSGILISPLAILLTFLSAFLPIGVIAWLNIEPDPDDAEVPYRFRQDAAVKAYIVTGNLVGVAAIIWLVLS